MQGLKISIVICISVRHPQNSSDVKPTHTLSEDMFPRFGPLGRFMSTLSPFKQLCLPSAPAVLYHPRDHTSQSFSHSGMN